MQRAVLGLDLRRRHHVELADLRVAREHLEALVVVADLERLGRHHAAAAERARLKARQPRLEARLGRGAALLVRELLLRREGLGREDATSVRVACGEGQGARFERGRRRAM